MPTNIELKDNVCALVLNDENYKIIYLKNDNDEDRILTKSEQLISGIGILLNDEKFVEYVLDEFSKKLNELEKKD
jgi:hypothetical protein